MLSPRFLVLPDTNVWIETHLFSNSVGSALTYYLARVDGRIALPEIVETEMSHVARRHAKDAASDAASAAAAVARFTAYADVRMPDEDDVDKAIADRLALLAPHLERYSLDLDVVRAALVRVVSHRAPNSEKREQFRDSLVWEVARKLAVTVRVAVVTADDDFWDKAGAAAPKRAKSHLYEDIRASGGNLTLHPDIESLLRSLQQEVDEPDHEEVADDILSILRGEIAEQVGKRELELGDLEGHKISAFRTENANRFAISFEFIFAAIERLDATTRVIRDAVTARGSCFLDFDKGAYTELGITSIEIVATSRDVRQYILFKSSGAEKPAG